MGTETRFVDLVFTLHVDHLAGHLVGVRVAAVVKLALRLEHLGRRDDEAGAYCSLQVMFLKDKEGQGYERGLTLALGLARVQP